MKEASTPEDWLRVVKGGEKKRESIRNKVLEGFKLLILHGCNWSVSSSRADVRPGDTQESNPSANMVPQKAA